MALEDSLNHSERVRLAEITTTHPWIFALRPRWNLRSDTIRILPADTSVSNLLTFMREHHSVTRTQGFVYGMRKDETITEIFLLPLLLSPSCQTFLAALEKFLEEDPAHTILGLAFVNGSTTFVFTPPDAGDGHVMNHLIDEVRAAFGKAAANVLRSAKKRIAKQLSPRNM